MVGLEERLYCGNGKIGFNGGYFFLFVFDIYDFNIIIMMLCIYLVFII